MDHRAVLAAFDEQVRRQPEPDPPDGVIERDRAGGARLIAGEINAPRVAP